MREYGAAVLHDFFVDRLVFAPDLDGLLRSVKSKSREGGGGIHGIAQEEIRGGNAVNLAHALGRLGRSTYLVTHSDQARMGLLRHGFEGLPVTLSVKAMDPGLTVAFEGRTKGSPFNVMLGHLGGAGRFGPELLSEDDWRALRSANIVCAVNWAANAKGSELVAALREGLGRKKILVDPADVRDRVAPYRVFLKSVRKGHILDWLSLNEYEALTTAKLLRLPTRNMGEACKKIAESLSVKVDVHTVRGSFTSEGKDFAFHGTKWLHSKRLTGAGDVWDAASVHFFLKGMGDERRLALADCAAGLYLRASEPVGPREDEVVSLLEHS